MITIKPLTYNPFSAHAGFRDIWPNRDNAPEDDCIFYLEESPDEFKFLICDADTPIGITGYWPLRDDTQAMAWSGVVASHRGKGAWPKAFKLMLDHIREHHPEAKYLVEPMPQERVAELGPYYERMGFRNTNQIMTDPQLYDAVVWIEFIYTL
jgi:hypothetical protein